MARTLCRVSELELSNLALPASVLLVYTGIDWPPRLMLLRDGFAFKLLAYSAIRWSLAADCTYHGTHDAVRASLAGGLYCVQVRARIGSATALPGSTHTGARISRIAEACDTEYSGL